MGGGVFNLLKAKMFRSGFALASRVVWRRHRSNVRVEDHVINKGQLSVRCYRPEGDDAPPVILYFHGGGFVIGDVESYDGMCRDLCEKSRYIVVSVDYRRAPEHRFPAAADDAQAALAWLVDQAASLNISTDRLYIAGDSAGGNLAAVTTLAARDQFPGLVKGQLLIYPVTAHYAAGFASYDECAKGYLLTRKQMIWFWDTYLGSAYASGYSDPRATPLDRDDLAGLPSTLVITAALDPLRDEGRAFVDKLRDVGVAVTHAEYEGCQHGFIGIMGPTESHNRAMEDMVAWLRHLEL